MNINIPSVSVVLPPNLMEAPSVDHHHLNTFLSPDKDKDLLKFGIKQVDKGQISTLKR